MDKNELATLTADIVAAHVSNNSVAVGDVANLIQQGPVPQGLRSAAQLSTHRAQLF
jgi:predicted transcriptional regulator